MSSDDFHILLGCLGFGFGSIFWLLLYLCIFGGRK